MITSPATSVKITPNPAHFSKSVAAIGYVEYLGKGIITPINVAIGIAK